MPNFWFGENLILKMDCVKFSKNWKTTLFGKGLDNENIMENSRKLK